MRGYAEEMAAAGKKLEDDDIISYILAGLDSDYNSFVENVSNRVEPIGLSTLYSQLLFAEKQKQDGHNSYQMSANAATRGNHGGYRGRSSRGGDGGCGMSTGQGGGGRPIGGCTDPRSGINNKPKCQICDEPGHIAKCCWYRYDDDEPEESKRGSVRR